MYLPSSDNGEKNGSEGQTSEPFLTFLSTLPDSKVLSQKFSQLSVVA
jgi:hypothetical protein